MKIFSIERQLIQFTRYVECKCGSCSEDSGAKILHDLKLKRGGTGG
jgi:hypothetical protein